MKKLFYLLLPILFNLSLSAQPLNGIYSIGPGGNYSSLTSALAFTSANGISGPVYFELNLSYDPSVEIYPITINSIPGASPQNRLTIRPALNTDTILFSSSNALFRFNGCSFVTIDGRPAGTGTDQKIILRHTGTFQSVIFINDTKYNSLKYLLIQGGPQCQSVVTFSSGIYTGSDYNTVEHCKLSSIPGSGFPPVIISLAAGYMVFNTSNLIDQCEITNFSSRGIYISGLTDSTVIRGCTFYLTSPAASSSICVIEADMAMYTRITGNKVYDIYSSNIDYHEINAFLISVLYELNMNSTLIDNNFISLNTTNLSEYGSVSGIKYSGIRGFTVEVYYNTILIGGDDLAGRSSYCINKADSSSSFIVKNNILVNRRATLSCPGKQYCFYAPVVTGIISDYNNYEIRTGGGVIGNWAGADLYTMEDWKNISKVDSHSTSKGVEFINNIDLHLAGISLGDLDLAALPLEGFTNDIDGQVRSSNFPYKGADENLEYPLPVELTQFTAAVSGSKILLSWSTASEVNNSGFYIQRSKSKNEWSDISFAAGRGTSNEVACYNFTDEPGYGVYLYRLKQLDLNGNLSYSEPVEVSVSDAKEFRLNQNYPNPFNPSTIINFMLAQKAFTTLKIFDITGQLVKELVSAELDPGSHSVEFNSSDLAGGIYFYELRSGNYHAINKMCLIK